MVPHIASVRPTTYGDDLWGGVEPFHTKKEKGKHPVEDACLRIELTKRNYSSTAACAAAKRAMGTRNGEQLT